MEGYVPTKWLFPHPFHRETYKGDWKNTWNTISSTKKACGFTIWTDLPWIARQKTGCNLDRIDNWLVVEPTPLKNICQNGNLPQIGVKIKHIWNHHLDKIWLTLNQHEYESMNVHEHAMELTSGKFRERVNQEMNTGTSRLCSVLWVVLCKQVAWRLRCSARTHAGWGWCYNSRHHRCLNAACKSICTMITMP